MAQTSLVTIQDTLFVADGTRFNGSLLIRWSTFDTSTGTIVQQSKSVRVQNGNLQVQLASNATATPPANSYTVSYQSDGREQFSEAWTVPQSARSLKVAEVRTSTLNSSGSGGSVGNQTPIAESAVVGLLTDLAQRPTKGPGFGLGAVAVINQSGQVETVPGNVGDCVYVDGTAGACGGPTPQYFDLEIPAGAIDGANRTFTLTNPPSALWLFRNGVYLKQGQDFTLSGSTITFVPEATPQTSDTLAASYRIDPAAGIAGNLVSGVNARTFMAQVLCSGTGQSTNGHSWVSLGACDLTSAALRPGDRIEVRFNFGHTGTAQAFDVQVLWGDTPILLRHAGAQDIAVTGRAEATLAGSTAQITSESWGNALTFLSTIQSATFGNGVRIDLQARGVGSGAEEFGLTNFTVIRYPGN